MAQQREIVDVFLCHNGADKEWVRTLGEQIESETFDGTSSGRPMRVFFDEWDIDVGQNVLLRLNMALTARAAIGERFLTTASRPLLRTLPWQSQVYCRS